MKNFGEKGSISLLFALVAGLLVAGIAGKMVLSRRSQQKFIESRVAGLESFYTNEIAEWQGYERTRLGLNPFPQQGQTVQSFASNLQNSYTTLTVGLAHQTYNRQGAAGTPYNLSTTDGFDPVPTLNQRFTPGSLTYEIQTRP